MITEHDIPAVVVRTLWSLFIAKISRVERSVVGAFAVMDIVFYLVLFIQVISFLSIMCILYDNLKVQTRSS
jgi:hypothetical protein